MVCVRSPAQQTAYWPNCGGSGAGCNRRASCALLRTPHLENLQGVDRRGHNGPKARLQRIDIGVRSNAIVILLGGFVIPLAAFLRRVFYGGGCQARKLDRMVRRIELGFGARWRALTFEGTRNPRDQLL